MSFGSSIPYPVILESEHSGLALMNKPGRNFSNQSHPRVKIDPETQINLLHTSKILLLTLKAEFH